MSQFTPALQIAETRGGNVRLAVACLASGEGPTLQEAADDLVRNVLIIALAIRTGDLPFSADCRPDPALLAFVWELGGIAAAGGDIRGRLFDAADAPASR